MSKTIWLVAFRFVALLAVQVLILNNINLFGYAEPMLYIWFILLLPVGTPKWLVLILSFLMGFSVDVFSGGVGIHTAVSTLTAAMRPIFLSSFESNQQSSAQEVPCSKNMGWLTFFAYISILTFVHVLLVISIETFRWSEILPILLRSSLSAVATIILIALCDIIFFRSSSEL